MNLDKLYKKLKEYRDALEKATLNAKSIPVLRDSADMGEDKERSEKMKDVNGKLAEQYNYEGEKVVHNRVPKKVAELKKKAPKDLDPVKHENCVMDVKAKGHDVGSAHAICTSSMRKEEEPDMASPEKPKGLENKRKPVTHDECGRPFAKDEDLDAKIRAKLKAEMDKRKFTEVDATRHVIDRDRGEKIAEKKPKEEKPLLQTEMIKFDNNGQWSLEKSNYGPKGMGLYSQKDNIKRKSNRTGVEVEGAGGNRAQKEWAKGGRDSTKSQLAREAKADQIKSSKNPVKVFTDEEKAALQAKYDEAKKVDSNGNEPGGNENDPGQIL